MVSADEARRELARRELDRRRSAGSPSGKAPIQAEPLQPAPAQQVMSAYEPGLLERAGNWLKDNNVLPIDRMKTDLQSADDLARLAAKGATFNQADRLAGFMSGNGTDAERVKTAAADERSGGAGDLAEVAGAVAVPLAAAKRGVTLVGEGAMAIPGFKGLLARTGLMGVEGGGYGAATAAGNDQDVIEGAKWGAILGAGGQLAGEGIGATVNALKAPASKSIDDLRSAKSAAYDRTKQLGIRYSPESFEQMATDALKAASEMSASSMRHPQTADMFRRIGQLVEGKASPTLTDMDQLRQVVWRDLANSTDGAEREFGRMIIDKIDDMIDTAAPIGGNGDEAAAAIKEARELNRRYKNAERFDEAMTKAQRRADSTDSGGNLENAQRQNVRQILDNPRKAKFLNAEEKASMEQMVSGTKAQNATRWIGKKLHSIPGVGAAAGLGMMGGPMAAVPIAALLAGGGFKAISRGMGNQNKAIVEALIREGKKPNPAISRDQIQVLSRLLLGGGLGATAP